MTGYWDADGSATANAPVSAQSNATLTINDLFLAPNMVDFALGSVTVGSGIAPTITAPGTDGAEWKDIPISKGAFTATLTEPSDMLMGRFLTGHTAVVGELMHTEGSGMLTGAFGAVKD